MKIYSVEFEGLYPVGNCLIIAARSKEEAYNMALRKITWQGLYLENVKEIDISKPCVVKFLSGDY